MDEIFVARLLKTLLRFQVVITIRKPQAARSDVGNHLRRVMRVRQRT
jgi:hypothetical protein